MQEFGPNGSVMGMTESSKKPLSNPNQETGKRSPVLAILIGGMCAPLLVTLFGWIALGFVLLLPAGSFTQDYNYFQTGYLFSASGSAFNFFVFFLTMPYAWIIMGLASLFMQVQVKDYSRTTYLRTGMVGMPIAILIPSLYLSITAYWGRGDMFALLAGAGLGAILVGIPAGYLLMKTYHGLLYSLQAPSS